MPELHPLFLSIVEMHQAVRDSVLTHTRQQQLDALAQIERDDEGDTIYRIDADAESITERFVAAARAHHSFVFIAEGLAETDDDRATTADATWRIIHDPIDGTRGLMYQKRSAWILTGVAPNKGPDTSLRDIVFAVQTEIPLLKQHLSDQIWAVQGEGVTAQRHNQTTGATEPFRLQPSTARSIAHGFATVSRFFPGARDALAAIDEEIVLGALGPVQRGKAHCFEDQYISTGGQLYELMAGHDRFIADLRPLAERTLAQRGLQLGICCHPYDMSTALIARECGVILTDARGTLLDAPLNVHADVDWVGYANQHIRAQIEPLLQTALRRRGWI
jgi:fructose-1,6-bisphosphatase/inositol monophosphatase family enzyme